jgi:hypothetical protein
MTLDDLLHENRDLIAFCTGLLAGIPRTAMKVEVNDATLTVATSGLDELETYADGRPIEAVRKIGDGTLQLPRPDAEAMEFIGRRRGEVCQRRRAELNGK